MENAPAAPAMTEDDARRITERIRSAVIHTQESIEKVQRLLAEAKDGGAHVALGYGEHGWAKYMADLFGERPLRLPRDQRKELVGYLAGEGMSSRSIAPIVGATDRQVRRDISGGTFVPPEMQGAPTPCPAPTVDRTTGEVADTGTDWPVVAGPFHWPLTGHKPKHVADIPASKPHNFHRDTVPKVHHGGMSR